MRTPRKSCATSSSCCCGSLHALVPGHRRVVGDRARRRQELAHDLVVRLVRQQAVAHPGVEGEVRGDVAGVVALVLQQRRPLVGEVVRVVGAAQQRLDQAVALVRLLAARGTPAPPPPSAGGRRCPARRGGGTWRRRRPARAERRSASGWRRRASSMKFFAGGRFSTGAPSGIEAL